MAGSAMMLSLMLAACGGGGGVNSTPTPTPTPPPTPAPPPPPQALGVTSGTTSYAASSVHVAQTLAEADGTVTNSSGERAGLTFSYDANNNVYSVSGSGAASTFGQAQFIGNDSSGDAHFDRGPESLVLFDPQRLGHGTQNISLGLWQTRTSDNDLHFDFFTYGFPTQAADIPLTGSATYAISLFGVVSPIGVLPRSITSTEGSSFSLDFAQGLFAMSGEAVEHDTDTDNWTCCHSWRGTGRLASNGKLTGYFALQGRDDHNYQTSILGALYGPGGAEVGGSLHGVDKSGATFAGAFAGTHERDGIDISLSVLGGGARGYTSLQGLSVASQMTADATSSEAAAYYFPGAYGAVTFGADGSITPILNINNASFQNVTFQPGDRIAAQSDGRFDVYEARNANGDYRLEMFKPGPGNPEIELTYSSFGHWREDRAIGDIARQSLSTWFSYGVRPVNGSLPATGSAHFSATVLGSGERFEDMAQLTLEGTSSINIDFATTRIDGTVNAQARTAANEVIAIPTMTFDVSGNSYIFNTSLYSVPGRSDGNIRGSLYGPGGEEIGGALEFHTRAQDLSADATYSGVFFGKRD